MESAEEYLCEVESSVVVNKERTEWFELHTGVRQGCILSPTLFAIFIDGLATLVKECTKGAELVPVELQTLLIGQNTRFAKHAACRG